jgi:glycosyltransferase involved in cell wall biosynthesis
MFLQVLTRTFGKRETMLARNHRSLLAQTDGDWFQTLIRDPGQRGAAWANGNLATVEAHGEWVWILDDDDECIDPEFVAGLKWCVEGDDADVVMVRMDHGPELGILPEDERWRQAPEHGHVGCSAFVVRRDVWNRFRHTWQALYHGDYLFVRGLWDAGLRFGWWDVVASRCQRGRMMGAAE